MIFSLATQLAEGVAAAAEAIRRGECVVLPTDTVYGVGADAYSPEAVQHLLDAKQRGRDMPPPVLLADVESLETVAKTVPPVAWALAGAFWPGPLTLVLKAAGQVLVQCGTVAVRVPAHEEARALLRATGLLAVSSANVSGERPATTVQEAQAMLGDSVAVYLDGGPTPGETPSTIVDLSVTPGRVLREGVLSLAELTAVWPDIISGAASA